MKMKKEIVTMLLAAALLTSSLTACSNVEAAGNDIDNTTVETSTNNQIITLNTPNTQTLISANFENYDSIINTYRKIVELCPQYESVNDEDYFAFTDNESKALYEKIFVSTLTLYPRDSYGLNNNCYEQFGYTLKDLNDDGINELILRLDNHEVIALFTLLNGKPILLGNFWNRKNCWIDPDGYLHISGSSGADKSVMQIYRISNETGELILLEEGGTDGYDEISSNTLYYKLVNNEKVYITQEEYDTWKQDFPYAKFEVTETISEYMPFVPLFNQNHPAPEPYVPQEKG